jgi:hypothetical protein
MAYMGERNAHKTFIASHVTKRAQILNWILKKYEDVSKRFQTGHLK